MTPHTTTAPWPNISKLPRRTTSNTALCRIFSIKFHNSFGYVELPTYIYTLIVSTPIKVNKYLNVLIEIQLNPHIIAS